MDTSARCRPQASVAQVAREFFPLPPASSVIDGSAGNKKTASSSRSSKRKVAVRDHLLEWADGAISALNSLYRGNEFVADVDCAGKTASLAQKCSVQRIFDLVKSMGKPPQDITGQGALSELRAKLGYDGEPTTLARLQEDLVSLPADGSQPAPLENILGCGAHFPCSLLESKVLPPGAVKELKAQCSLKSPYFDPHLKYSRRAYASFVRRLHNSGVVEYRRSCREQCGLFCVWKKSGRQRLVVDARLTNLWFAKPEDVSLATGFSFGAIEVDGHGPIQLAGVDIADAFYNIELPASLRDLFGLRPLKAVEVGVSSCEGIPIGSGDQFFPVFKAVPMGWTHALWLCQYLHEKVVDSISGLGEANRFVDGRPPPDLHPLIHTEYVDNFVALSQQVGVAEQAAREVSSHLQKRGLPVHEVEAGNGGETLGWKFLEDAPVVAVTPRRLWKLRLATLELLKVNHASGHLIEVILGHYTFVGLLCREFLSVFQACYAFCRKHYHTDVPLWPQVRRELVWACNLLPLVRRDLSAGWSERVYATDASHWGRGVAVVTKPKHEVRQVGRINDRWKFNRNEENLVKEVEDATQQLPDAFSLEVPPPVLPQLAHDAARHKEARGMDGNYVPLQFLEGDWKQLSNGPWERMESIPVLEGRAIVWVLQHLARSSKQHSFKHLILTDSMSCTLAITKGRSSTGSMNRICRQVAAILLSTGMRIGCCWVPSELNPADRPSRGMPWQYFDARATAKTWCGHAATSKPVRTQGWRHEAFEQVRDELGLAESASGGATVVRAQSQKDASEAESEAAEGFVPTGDVPWPCSQHEPRNGPDFLGEEVSECSQGGVIQAGVGPFGDSSSLLQSSPHLLARVGYEGHCAHQQHVLGGAHTGGCPHSVGSCEVHEARCEKGPRFDPFFQSSQGLQEIGASYGPGAHSLPMLGQDCAILDQQGRVDGRILDASHLGCVCETRRDLEAPVETLDPSIQAAASVDGGVERAGCIRGCSPVKGGRNGRKCDIGSTLPVMAGIRPVTHEGNCSDHVSHLQFSHELCRAEVPQRSGGPEVPRNRNYVLLSDQARQCQHRSDAKAAQPPRHHEERPVEIHRVNTPLCERWPGRRDFRLPHHRSARLRNGCRRDDPKDVGSFAMQAPDQNCVLELFSGSGHFSRALRRCVPASVHVYEVDINHGPQFDLTKRSFQRFIFKLIKKGKVVMVWLGTPRNSWSRARRGDGTDPPLLRNQQYVWGIPGLSESDAHKVAVGNILLKFSAAVFRLCLRLQIPVVLENPHTSMIWYASPVQHLLTHRSVNYEFTDFCQDGCQYRKRTRFLFAFLDLRHCCRHCSARRGRCNKSGKPHQQLVGCPNGVFLTKLAEPYPLSLCRRLASTIGYSIAAKIAEPIHELFNR